MRILIFVIFWNKNEFKEVKEVVREYVEKLGEEHLDFVERYFIKKYYDD